MAHSTTSMALKKPPLHLSRTIVTHNKTLGRSLSSSTTQTVNTRSRCSHRNGFAPGQAIRETVWYQANRMPHPNPSSPSASPRLSRSTQLGLKMLLESRLWMMSYQISCERLTCSVWTRQRSGSVHRLSFSKALQNGTSLDSRSLRKCLNHNSNQRRPKLS